MPLYGWFVAGVLHLNVSIQETCKDMTVYIPYIMAIHILIKMVPPVGSGTPAFRLGSRIDPHRHRGVVKVH